MVPTTRSREKSHRTSMASRTRTTTGATARTPRRPGSGEALPIIALLAFARNDRLSLHFSLHSRSAGSALQSITPTLGKRGRMGRIREQSPASFGAVRIPGRSLAAANRALTERAT
jgi:hypothetical protein